MPKRSKAAQSVEQRQLKQHLREQNRRQLLMIIQAASSVIVALLTLWLAWNEAGWSIFLNPITWALLGWWMYMSIQSFSLRWEETKKRTSDEKIDHLIISVDSLIHEIRQDRNERRNNHH